MSNKEANKLISAGKIKVNQKTVFENCVIKEEDEISINGETIRPAKKFILMKYYKPVGKVSSLSPKVNDSLYDRFKDYLPLCIAGRLDKYSEGLLLLTNDGKWAQELTHPHFEKPKTYLVRVDKAITEAFIFHMRDGVEIMGQKTKAALCKQLQEFEFEITLTEGKNRQIRRMCRKQGYRVKSLKRLSAGNYKLGTLKPDEMEMLNFS